VFAVFNTCNATSAEKVFFYIKSPFSRRWNTYLQHLLSHTS